MMNDMFGINQTDLPCEASLMGLALTSELNLEIHIHTNQHRALNFIFRAND